MSFMDLRFDPVQPLSFLLDCYILPISAELVFVLTAKKYR